MRSEICSPTPPCSSTAEDAKRPEIGHVTPSPSAVNDFRSEPPAPFHDPACALVGSTTIQGSTTPALAETRSGVVEGCMKSSPLHGPRQEQAASQGSTPPDLGGGPSDIECIISALRYHGLAQEASAASHGSTSPAHAGTRSALEGSMKSSPLHSPPQEQAASHGSAPRALGGDQSDIECIISALRHHGLSQEPSAAGHGSMSPAHAETRSAAEGSIDNLPLHGCVQEPTAPQPQGQALDDLNSPTCDLLPGSLPLIVSPLYCLDEPASRRRVRRRSKGRCRLVTGPAAMPLRSEGRHDRSSRQAVSDTQEMRRDGAARSASDTEQCPTVLAGPSLECDTRSPKRLASEGCRQEASGRRRDAKLNDTMPEAGLASCSDFSWPIRARQCDTNWRLHLAPAESRTQDTMNDHTALCFCFV